MATKPKTTPFKTPKGTAMYPWLNVADTQFNNEGIFKVNLRMSPDEAKPIVDEIKEIAKEAFGNDAKTATLPIKKDEDTGDVILMTKSKFKPRFVDSQGEQIAEDAVPTIFGGSELKVGGQLYPYKAGGRHGVSLQLGAVQIISLADSSYGAGVTFEAEKDGYVFANDNDNQAGDYNF